MLTNRLSNDPKYNLMPFKVAHPKLEPEEELMEEFVYLLVLNPDSQSNGHCQWFYFGVKNNYGAMLSGPGIGNTNNGSGTASPNGSSNSTLRNRPYKLTFVILNLKKPWSLFQIGMKPVV